MVSPILIALNRDYTRGTIVPGKDCNFQGDIPRFRV